LISRTQEELTKEGLLLLLHTLKQLEITRMQI
jgi:hypothetical protein